MGNEREVSGRLYLTERRTIAKALTVASSTARISVLLFGDLCRLIVGAVG